MITCVCGGQPKLEYNCCFKSRMICPACNRKTRWHSDSKGAGEEWEDNQKNAIRVGVR